MFKHQKVLLDPEDSGGGGGNTVVAPAPQQSSAPFKLGGQMPASLKETTFDIDDATEEAGEKEVESKINDGQKNKAAPDVVPAKIGEVKPLTEEAKLAAVKPIAAAADTKSKGLNIPPSKAVTTDKPVAEKPAIDLKVSPTVAQKSGRDYSAYPEDMAKVLKGMSNEAFSVFDKTYKELNELKPKATEATTKLQELEKNGFPQEWYNHDRAFSLHPRYQEAINDLNYINYERDFYQKQLELIEEGEEFQIVQGYDKRTGNPVLSDMLKPTSANKVEILRRFAEAGQLSKQTFQLASNIEQTFKQRYGAAKQYVDQVVENKWPWHKDPNHPSQKWVKELMDAVPAEFRNDHNTRVSALLYASLNESLVREQEKDKEIERLKSLKSEEAKEEESLSSTTIDPKNTHNFSIVNGVKAGNYKPPTEFNED